MSTANDSELERRVADVLHHRLETAMSRTDTEKQYDLLASRLESSARRRRVAWGIGAVTAAAALVLVLVLSGFPGASSDRSQRQVPPARGRTPVQIASDFVDALAAYDATNADHDLASSGDDLRIWPGEPSLSDGLAWAEAAGCCPGAVAAVFCGWATNACPDAAPNEPVACQAGPDQRGADGAGRRGRPDAGVGRPRCGRTRGLFHP
jgi:hypothetical protein